MLLLFFRHLQREWCRVHNIPNTRIDYVQTNTSFLIHPLRNFTFLSSSSCYCLLLMMMTLLLLLLMVRPPPPLLPLLPPVPSHNNPSIHQYNSDTNAPCDLVWQDTIVSHMPVWHISFVRVVRRPFVPVVALCPCRRRPWLYYIILCTSLHT